VALLPTYLIQSKQLQLANKLSQHFFSISLYSRQHR